VCRRHAYVAKCHRLAQNDLKLSNRQIDDECNGRTRTSEMMLQGVRAEEFTVDCDCKLRSPLTQGEMVNSELLENYKCFVTMAFFKS